MELEQNIIKDSFSPSPASSQPKGKKKENSKAVVQDNLRDSIPKAQQIVNNIDANKIPLNAGVKKML